MSDPRYTQAYLIAVLESAKAAEDGLIETTVAISAIASFLFETDSGFSARYEFYRQQALTQSKVVAEYRARAEALGRWIAALREVPPDSISS